MYLKKKIVLLIGVTLFLFSPFKTMGSELTTKSQVIDGNYQVVIKPSNYASYRADIKITSIDTKTIQVSGSYNGFPISVRGKLRDGSRAAEMSTYDFQVNNNFFSGQVTLNIQQQNKDKLLNGYGSGNYRYLGNSGTTSAVITGISEKGYFNMTIVIVAALFLTGLFIIIFGFRKRNLL